MSLLRLVRLFRLKIEGKTTQAGKAQGSKAGGWHGQTRLSVRK